MYTGSMIDELIASVQRAEVSAAIEEWETYHGHEYSFAVPGQTSASAEVGGSGIRQRAESPGT